MSLDAAIVLSVILVICYLLTAFSVHWLFISLLLIWLVAFLV